VVYELQIIISNFDFLIHHENIKPIIILGESILPWESKTIDMEIAKLHNTA
jgi:hypothetical protein